MSWWLWMLFGLGLLAAETVTPGGFFVFFFGVSAIVVGLLDWMELAGPDWVQWLSFSGLSIASLLLLRPRLVSRFTETSGNAGSLPNLVGDTALLLDDLVPGGVAKAELRGSSWTVRSRGSHPIARGSRCRVERVEGLTLWIAPPA